MGWSSDSSKGNKMSLGRKLLTDAWKRVKSNRNSQHTVFIWKLDIDDSRAIRTGWYTYGIKHELVKCNDAMERAFPVYIFFPFIGKHC